MGAIVVAAYTQIFGAAYESMHWFLGLLSFVLFVCVAAACIVAKETPLERRSTDKQSPCQTMSHAFSTIFTAVRGLPVVLVVYCIVSLLNQYAFAACNGNKGMFFGIEIFHGDPVNSATCGDDCSEAQINYTRGVRLPGGLTDLLFCGIGYLYSWLIPPLVRRFGAQYVATAATLPQVLLMVMAFTDVVEVDVVIVAFTATTLGTFFALVVPLVVHVFGHDTDIGVYVGVITSANTFGQLLSFTVGSALVQTSMGYRLPIFVGGIFSLLAFLVSVFFFRVRMYSL